MSATDWELFLRDIALCLATYQGRGPAVVWPDRAHAVLPRLRDPHGRHARREPRDLRGPRGPGGLRGPRGAYGGRADAGPRPAPRGTGAGRLAADLGHRMGYAVEAFQHTLPAERALALRHPGADTLVCLLQGGARCHVEGPGRPGGEGWGIDLRLCAGEVFYTPAGHSCTLSGARAPCPLLLLVLRAVP
ncbi:cupin domain-containing protein [Streptomyces sparsogenes]|uniref:hypothetical protein n=1 Tax=Streptomyces sparsogenes TaxID=67365 RepID=UPI000825A01E|nr:hypothetical protein [Streptomyces sparsogenes]